MQLVEKEKPVKDIIGKELSKMDKHLAKIYKHLRKIEKKCEKKGISSAGLRQAILNLHVELHNIGFSYDTKK